MQKEYKSKDIIEYIIAIVNEFAARYNLTEKQAYRYISFHNGITFIEQHYGIIHTLNLKDAIDSIALFCKNKGGKL